MARDANVSRQGARRPDTNPDRRVNVFISYNNKDRPIADAIKGVLEDRLQERVRVFVDHTSIERGDLWREKIVNEITNADWFIFIYTGQDKNYEYCMWEAGQFERDNKGGKERMICLYDTSQPPRVFLNVQNVKVAYAPELTDVAAVENFYEESPVKHFLREFFLHPVANPIDRAWDLSGSRSRRLEDVRKITLAFESNSQDRVDEEVLLQKRLEVVIQGLNDERRRAFRSQKQEAIRKIFDEMEIAGDKETMSIFKMLPSKGQKWKDLRVAFNGRGFSLVPWMSETERAISQIVFEGADPDPLESTFLSAKNDSIVYRPIIGRYKKYYKGSYKIYISLLATRRRELASDVGDPYLLFGLYSAARSRRVLLEKPLPIFDQQVTGVALDAECMKLKGVIDLLEHEAAEMNLLNLDVALRAVGDEQSAYIQESYRRWEEIKGVLFTAIDARFSTPKEDDAITKRKVRQFLDELREMSDQYMVICSRILADKISADLARSRRVPAQ